MHAYATVTRLTIPLVSSFQSGLPSGTRLFRSSLAIHHSRLMLFSFSMTYNKLPWDSPSVTRHFISQVDALNLYIVQ